MSSINYSKVVQTLIARFDLEVSSEQHFGLLLSLNLKERRLYFNLELEMSKKGTDVLITTSTSRKIREQRHEIEKPFKD